MGFGVEEINNSDSPEAPLRGESGQTSRGDGDLPGHGQRVLGRGISYLMVLFVIRCCAWLWSRGGDQGVLCGFIEAACQGNIWPVVDRVDVWWSATKAAATSVA